MRLINTTTLEFQDTFTESPHYAILSHRWSRDEATLTNFGEFRTLDISRTPRPPERTQSMPNGGLSEDDGQPKVSNGIRKALEFCRIAKERGLEWAWLDTVCIDKTSSVELSEAINSM